MLRIITHIVVTLVIVQVIFTEKVSAVCFPFLQICCLQYILASIVWKTWYRTSCKCDALLKHWNKDESSVRIPKTKRLSVEIDFLRQTISIWWWKIFFCLYFNWVRQYEDGFQFCKILLTKLSVSSSLISLIFGCKKIGTKDRALYVFCFRNGPIAPTYLSEHIDLNTTDHGHL